MLVKKTEEPHRQVLILLNKESLSPCTVLKVAVSYGFERVVLIILQTEARAAHPLPTMGSEKKGEETKLEIDSSLSDAVSTGGGSSVDGSIFSLEHLFEKDRFGNDYGTCTLPSLFIDILV